MAVPCSSLQLPARRPSRTSKVSKVFDDPLQSSFSSPAKRAAGCSQQPTLAKPAPARRRRLARSPACVRSSRSAGEQTFGYKEGKRSPPLRAGSNPPPRLSIARWRGFARGPNRPTKVHPWRLPRSTSIVLAAVAVPHTTRPTRADRASGASRCARAGGAARCISGGGEAHWPTSSSTIGVSPSTAREMTGRAGCPRQ